MTDAEPATVTDGRDNLPFMVHSELDDLDLDPYEFRAYAHMVRRAGKQSGKGEHWESVEESAKHCRMDPKTYRRALAGLVERRLVTREDRAGQTSVYRLTAPKLWRPLPKTVEVAARTPATSGTPTESGSPTTSGRGTPATSGRTPLPKTVDKGNPLKVIPRRESKEPRAQAHAARSSNRSKAKKPKLGDFDPKQITLPEFIDQEPWNRFIDNLHALGKTTTEPSVRQHLEDLAKHPDDANEMLRAATAGEWVRVFALDKPRTSSHGNPAAAAWDQILDSARRGKPPDNLDPAAKKALQAIGGWSAVAYCPEHLLGHRRRQFLDAHTTPKAAKT